MKFVWQATALAVVLVVLAGAAFGAWSIAGWIAGLDPALAGPTVTAALGFAGLLYAQWHSKTREIAQSHRPQKVDLYNGFFEIMEQFLKKPDAL